MNMCLLALDTNNGYDDYHNLLEKNLNITS